jgi:DNA-binding CsgD family transcriptional regulator
MKMETAQGYVDRLGSTFHTMITDPKVQLHKIEKKYDISRGTLFNIRHLLNNTTPKPHARNVTITPEMIALFKTKMPNHEVAKIIGMTANQVNHHRSKYRQNTKIKSLRLDGPTVALLKSDLPIKDVARALKVGIPAVCKNRNALLNRTTSYKQRPLTADLVARVYACRDPESAHRETGVPLFTAKALFVRRRILAGEEQTARKSKHAARFPTDPTWWEARTQKQICQQLKISPGAVWYHAATRGYTYKGMQIIDA